MTDYDYHARLAKEQRDAAITEYEHRRYSTVGHLTLMAVEQAVEAPASREGKHFHEHPRDAHKNRVEWIAIKFPGLVIGVKTLWSIRAELGYGGVDGDKAREAVTIMEGIFDELRI